MNQTNGTLSSVVVKRLAVVVAIVVIVAAAALFRNQWLPKANELVASIGGSASQSDAGSSDAGHDGHDGHDHGDGDGDGHDDKDGHSHDDGHDHAHDGGHDGHNEANSLELSPQARKNVGLKTAEVQLQLYVRTVSMPATVSGRPGRSHVEVTAPLGGRVTRVYPIEGEAVNPGQPLFDLRLTHEELVRAQSEFLRSAEELDVELREIKRLQSAGAAIAGKTIRQREYEKQKLDATLNAQKQSLLLHGLTQEEIEGILKNRKLVQGVTVVAPPLPKNGYSVPPTHPFTLRSLFVKPGQYVEAGAQLCLLVDYAELFIKGRAFEHDGHSLLRASREKWKLTATTEDNPENPEVIEGLEIVYVDNEIDPESRALYFYVGLPNKVVQEGESAHGHRFLSWKYRPGQRMQIRVPIEEWPDRIVLPVDAVAKEGAEKYVFQQNGNHFDRVPVQVEYQDQLWAVIANDGSISPGDTVAISGAHQLQMALKNKAGGGVDPHAGHNH